MRIKVKFVEVILFLRMGKIIIGNVFLECRMARLCEFRYY